MLALKHGYDYRGETGCFWEKSEQSAQAGLFAGGYIREGATIRIFVC